MNPASTTKTHTYADSGECGKCQLNSDLKRGPRPYKLHHKQRHTPALRKPPPELSQRFKANTGSGYEGACC